MWKTIANKANKARIVETEGRNRRKGNREKKTKREKKEFRKPIVEKEMKIARIVEEK